MNSNIVTIIISAFNAEKFLAEAIDSVLIQSLGNFELILIDDGSTDGTLQIFKKYKQIDKRILIDSHKNIGMGESVNRAVKMANSELIARMDADDVMIDTRLEEQVKFMNSHPEIAITSCLTEFINQNGKSIGGQDFPQTKDLQTLDDTKRYVSEKKCIHFAHTGMICRKSAFLEVGGYDGKYWPSDDIELFNKVADKGYGVVVLPKKLMKYRLHNDSIITSKFYESVIKLYWVEDCIYRRRRGQHELTFLEYSDRFNSRPLLKRIRSFRVIFANHYFRQAGINYSNGNYYNFTWMLATSIILRPINILKRIFGKLSPNKIR